MLRRWCPCVGGRVTWDSSWSKEETAKRLGGAILRIGDSGTFLLVRNDPGRTSSLGEPKLVVSAPNDVSKNQHKTASYLDTALGHRSSRLSALFRSSSLRKRMLILKSVDIHHILPMLVRKLSSRRTKLRAPRTKLRTFILSNQTETTFTYEKHMKK